MTASRILIADDDPLLRSLLVHRLSADGHDVLVAGDGAQALASIAEQKPDLIVLDALMPIMDGFEVLRRLKAGRLSTAPIIMLTALKREQDIVGALQLGAADYLVKPFIPDELSERVRRLLLAAPLQTREGGDDRNRA
ncbi:MAG: response regulator transcription factor [Brevundimonas sp.]|uniref:response regulator transcription factor n=1 Tax=Brevundimonas sp. TaxID=1871086 RepID=UPI00260E22F0|nr:response regulator transcription factor [Brevundimonas sp.]MDI6625622.1 response regulator transcription factor [Brevundimonas sp.]MDQ7813755.1 response regulator transcription factor [Brevundimonas sp.]